MIRERALGKSFAAHPPGQNRGAHYFRRWLVHSIASYYGLRTWSVTVGDPARREAYVGIPQQQVNGKNISPLLKHRPLWGMV